MTLLRFGVGLLLGSVAACAVVPHTSPTLVYSTYLGGPMTDDCDGIAVDAVGAMYLACHIYSAEYPDQSFVVIKLAPDGQAIEYNTRVGEGNASFIAVDKDGSAYVGGWTTAPDFPVTQGAFQPSFAGGERDLVVAKLAPNGDVVWSTFLGGAGDDVPAEVALDTAGSVYVVGTTDSANFPVTADAFQTRYQGNRDVFVTKLTASGTAVYSTYLGGSGSEERLAGIALADDGGAFVVGTTRSTDFPLVSPLQATRRGESDAFVAALDPAGKALRFSTYLGGSASEVTRHAAVDGQGNLYVAGRTMSADFPTTPGTLQPTHSGASAVFFVTKIEPSQRTLIYSTFVTYTGRTAKPTDWRAEWGLGHIAGLAVDGAGRACIVGGTSLTDYPVVRPVQAALRGESDGFVTQLDPTGSSLTFSTYLGGSGLDDFEDVAVDAKGNVFVTGLTQSTDFPLVKPLQASFGGPDYDIVVLKLTPQAESRKSFSAKYSR